MTGGGFSGGSVVRNPPTGTGEAGLIPGWGRSHPVVGDGQGGLAFCDSWGCKESDTTERLN